MHYTFHQLQIFISVCENESITKASEELNLTQPAVSIQMKKFQDQFDVPLTEVIGRKLYITDFGKKIVEVAQKVVETSQELKFMNDSYKGLITGDVKISIVSTGKYVMPFFLRGFSVANPGVNLSIDVTNKSTVIETLNSNSTDFALISVVPDGLKTEKIDLLDNCLYLVGSSRYSSDLGESLDVSQLSELTFIFREEGSATRMAMTSFLETHGIKPKRTMQLVSNEAVKQAVKAGLGYSIMPIIGLKEEIQGNSIRIIPMKGFPIKTQWQLVYNKGKKLSPANLALKDYIEKNKTEIMKEHFNWIKEL